MAECRVMTHKVNRRCHFDKGQRLPLISHTCLSPEETVIFKPCYHSTHTHVHEASNLKFVHDIKQAILPTGKQPLLYTLVWQQIYQLKSTNLDASPLISWSSITWSFVCFHVLFYNTFLPFDINVTVPITTGIPLMLSVSITLKLYI